ncbi:MAG: hypothetical protein JEY94_12725 [Melioribacteraceae bacterium]|nr:hypothetical protein [Melioribacteraceae bacterium]
MKDIKKSKIENMGSIIAGLAAGLLFSVYITELLQFAIASLFATNNLHLNLTGINIYSLFYVEETLELQSIIAVYLSPYFCTIFITEIILYFLKKTEVGFSRFSMIIFLIMITGYIIISVFYGSIITILEYHSFNDVTLFFAQLKLTPLVEIGIIFLIVFLTLGYVSSVFKRVQSYITSF